MAIETQKTLRNQVMYSVFVRQFSPEGTLDAVRAALPRIRALGVDVIWLMPIHPIGERMRKGTLGSPYAIRDYRAVNPELGTRADFVALVDAIHALGMKCIMDVVFNHTAPDSVLAATHPEWFYHRPDGSFGNRVGDWGDVIDLDYGQPGLWAEQVETLKQWAAVVDGFRCDVAPLVPLAFWQQARREVEQVRPGCLWLSESVEPVFIRGNRAQGIPTLSDSEVYQAFDVCYDYDIYGEFDRALHSQDALPAYAEAVTRQEAIYPDNYVKLRFLENHDRPRIRALVPDARMRRNWTAFLYFQKGMTLLYNGQEVGCAHYPSLFERDPLDWNAGEDHAALLARLYRMKQHPLFTDSAYTVQAHEPGVLLAEHRKGEQRLLGIFSVRGEPAQVQVNAPDGVYENLVDGLAVRCEGGHIATEGEPIILEVAQA